MRKTDIQILILVKIVRGRVQIHCKVTKYIANTQGKYYFFNGVLL